MKTKTIFAAALAVTASTGVIYADHHEGDDKPAAAVEAKQDIVTIASAAENFSTLVTALKAAGLVNTLKGEGPFTVFAPTNEAFEDLPEGTVIKLLKPENKAQLVKILTYHVAPKKLVAENLGTMPLATVEGSEAAITLDGETVMIDGAKVVQADIMASNGVIHVINKVLLPTVEETEE